MLSDSDFVRRSLDLNLFFLRIMKEHSLFLEAGFVGKNSDLAAEAEGFKDSFNALLRETVTLADGNVSPSVLNSGEVVTDKTIRAEQKTQELSGIQIDMVLTENEMMLMPGEGDPGLAEIVESLNSRIIELTNQLIIFKTRVLEGMLNCVLFTYNFPTLIEHIRREAEHYVHHLIRLRDRLEMDPTQELIGQKVFWDEIMGEHAQFIAHLLDPAEKNLIKQANSFADRFDALERRAQHVDRRGRRALNELVSDEIRATRAIKDFKNTADEMILECQVRSLIIPLLADHVLREAGHFLNILDHGYQMRMR